MVAVFVKMSTRVFSVIPDMRASLYACVPLMVHLQTAWNPTTRIKEVRRAKAFIPEEACKRARWCCMRCSLQFVSISFVFNLRVFIKE